MTDPRHVQESREDLDERFRTLSFVLVRARERIPFCTVPECATCLLLGEPVDLPASLLQDAPGPREHLEQGVEAIAARLVQVSQHEPVTDCPAAAHARDFYERCERAYAAQRAAGP